MLVFGAANHDPEVFPDPHSLLLDRENNCHVTFGWGIHRCAGANLALVELRLIADRLLDAQPFELAGEAEFGHMAHGGTFVGLRPYRSASERSSRSKGGQP